MPKGLTRSWAAWKSDAVSQLPATDYERRRAIANEDAFYRHPAPCRGRVDLLLRGVRGRPEGRQHPRHRGLGGRQDSFGCGNDADFTYFGKACFDEALRRTDSFSDAFEMARTKPTVVGG